MQNRIVLIQKDPEYHLTPAERQIECILMQIEGCICDHSDNNSHAVVDGFATIADSLRDLMKLCDAYPSPRNRDIKARASVFLRQRHTRNEIHYSLAPLFEDLQMLGN